MTDANIGDAYEVLLPSRAYLLSWREQTIPARDRALRDSEGRYDAALPNKDLVFRDMALLGLIGDAMQVVEDIAYVGTAFESPIAGMPNYVTATVYSGTRTTTFYNRIHRWSDERLKVLSGLWVRDPESQRAVSLADALELDLTPLDQAALEEAEAATLDLLRGHMVHLAQTWLRYGRYFHAHKHGGLLISRDDFALQDDDGNRLDPAIAVWWRHQDQRGHGDTNHSSDDAAHDIRRSGHLALDVLRFLVDARLRPLEMLQFSDDGEVVGSDGVAPWEFWFHDAHVRQSARDRLNERFGLVFERTTEISGRSDGSR